MLGNNIELNYLDSIKHSESDSTLYRLRYLDNNIISGNKVKTGFREGGYCSKDTEFANFSGVIGKNVKLINCSVGSNVHIFNGTFVNCVFKNSVTIFDNSKNAVKNRDVKIEGITFEKCNAFDLDKFIKGEIHV